ncbi:hypothetical protein LCGC14_0587700 [marine sediment metagenome]|uniref:Uncharacterized protein n=1 Tax=marine sediment metagenome TaxID=412755 RepID=A0A0F9RY85_9ZZZZ
MSRDTDRADDLVEAAMVNMKDCDEVSSATNWCACAKQMWRNLALPLVEAQRHRESLWQLLDYIDTLYDSCKGDEHTFYEQVKRIHAKRHESGRSDGHKIVWESMGIFKKQFCTKGEASG